MRRLGRFAGEGQRSSLPVQGHDEEHRPFDAFDVTMR